MVVSQKKNYGWKLDGKDFEGYPLRLRKHKSLERWLGIIQKVNMINYEQFKMIHFLKRIQDSNMPILVPATLRLCLKLLLFIIMNKRISELQNVRLPKPF